MTKPLSTTAQAVFWDFNSKFDWIEDGVPGPQFKAIAAALRTVVDKLSYEYHYHMDDGEGGIQYNCKNTIIDVNELNEIIHELEALK